MASETLRRSAFCPHCDQELSLRLEGSSGAGLRRPITYFHCHTHGTIPYPTVKERP